MRKIKEILKLNFENISNREISRRLRIGATCVSLYLARAKAAGLVWPLSDKWSDEKIYSLLFPVENKNIKHPLPDFGKVHRELKRNTGKRGYRFKQAIEEALSDNGMRIRSIAKKHGVGALCKY